MNNDKKGFETALNKNCSFKVPEGYFENFADDLMSKIPESQTPMTVKISMWRKLRPVVAVAACACVAAISVVVFINKDTDTSNSYAQTDVETIDSQSDYGTFDMAADYTMIDNDDIYAIVSEEQ